MHQNVLKNNLFENSVLDERDQFVIKFAETPEELEKAFRLRYRVFNLEQGKGLDSALENGIDRDEFDDHCLHLIIVDKTNNETVGTYRIHFGPVARQNRGLYSAREYQLTGVESIIDDCIEVGRSCVSPAFRNGAVVALLWTGLARIMAKSKYRFLIGCVSLENEEPAVGWALYEQLKDKGLVSDLLQAVPQEQFLLPRPAEERIQELLASPNELKKEIPPLFKGYLRLGTKICGPPAFDYEFGSIDFMILLDVNAMPERYWRHFF